ncbi:hypothetical protein SD71_17840 [Cohnella kolymensis]|uniref:Uncharacterized protein n=1 Tax=Cohnella kolymensis TaxID=1590652 RepID=A0ABR5A2J8_9BACL|nr:hypothetical protein [Cohnella kolymensis]KIL34863.1 hypothetical protein SD71_17840 [Cohnella kolymensis]
MKESNNSSAWTRYVEAKRHALSDSKQVQPAGTLEELEAAIAEAAATSGIPETGMPPRAVVHPSKGGQLSRWFYLLLVLLFAGLAASLIWWGYKHYS